MTEFVAVLSVLLVLAGLKSETCPPAVAAAKSENNELDPSDCLEEDTIENNKTYCSNIRNYPEEDHLDKLIRNTFSDLKALFGEDSSADENIESRAGYDPDEEYLCRSRQVTIKPKSALNRKNKWTYIVNSKQYQQTMRIDECLDLYTACGKKVGITLPKNYQSSCEQQYIFNTLVAYDSKQDVVFQETFRTPACCKCVLRNTNKG